MDHFKHMIWWVGIALISGEYVCAQSSKETFTWEGVKLGTGSIPQGAEYLVVLSSRAYVPEEKAFFSHITTSPESRSLGLGLVLRQDETWFYFPMSKEELQPFIKCEQEQLLYVHGARTHFPGAIEEGFFLQEHYGVQIILFSWPSHVGVKDLLASKQVTERIARVGTKLREASRYLHDFGVSTYTILGFSLGTAALAFARLDSMDTSGPNIKNLVLVAPILPQSTLYNMLAKIPVQDSMYVFFHGKDKGLWLVANKPFGRSKTSGRIEKNVHFVNVGAALTHENRKKNKVVNYRVWAHYYLFECIRFRNQSLFTLFKRIFQGRISPYSSLSPATYLK